MTAADRAVIVLENNLRINLPGSNMPHTFNIADVKVGLDQPMFVMAGPCVIESLDNCLEIADRLVQIREKTGVKFIFKASFDKANRSSITS